MMEKKCWNNGTYCKINLFLTWSTNCVISNAVSNHGATFVITDTHPYLPIVTLLTQDNVKLLQQMK